MKNVSHLTLRWACLLLAILVTSAAAQDFPLRSRYNGVPVIESEALYKRLDAVVVVDVRSRFEYETLHIKGALNIPISNVLFPQEVRKLREQSSKPIVFYCNGVTCTKSYDAVTVVQRYQIKDVYAYDAGIAHWARAYLDNTVLLGKSPVEPGHIIDEKRFKEHVITPEQFTSKIGPATIVLDIRDRAQRDAALFPMQEERVPLDDRAKINEVIERAKREHKTLMVYDAVGKQVEWFQYHLEQKGVSNYYFMDGGASAFFDKMVSRKE